MTTIASVQQPHAPSGAPIIVHPTPDTMTGPEATGTNLRLASRSGAFTKPTSGQALTFVQANLIVLPSRYASDFRLLCQRNPVPCPLLAESRATGAWGRLKSWIPGVTDDRIARDVDLRRDIPKYVVYRDGLVATFHCTDVLNEWNDDDHVAFLVGCSFSFESALAAAGLIPPHMAYGRNVPMYKTKIPLCPAGVFASSTYVVSLRMYRRGDVERVRNITRPYVTTHGEPIDWGWDAVDRLGINDLTKPEYGDPPTGPDGLPIVLTTRQPNGDTDESELVPVFWGCGVTPQQAVMQAGLTGTVIGHAPGHMLVLDVRDWDIVPEMSRT